MSNQDGSESVVLSTTNKDDALTLRANLLKEFNRMWVYVYNFNNETFEVKIANNIGSKVDSVVLKAVEKFILDKKLTPTSSVVAKKSVKKGKLD